MLQHSYSILEAQESSIHQDIHVYMDFMCKPSDKEHEDKSTGV